MNKDAIKLRAIAQELREHPERWTQHDTAKDASGEHVFFKDQNAVCWCTFGLLLRAGLTGEEIRSTIRKEIGYESIAEWNDAPNRTVQAVIAAFDKAADILESA